MLAIFLNQTKHNHLSLMTQNQFQNYVECNFNHFGSFMVSGLRTIGSILCTIIQHCRESDQLMGYIDLLSDIRIDKFVTRTFKSYHRSIAPVVGPGSYRNPGICWFIQYDRNRRDRWSNILHPRRKIGVVVGCKNL